MGNTVRFWQRLSSRCRLLPTSQYLGINSSHGRRAREFHWVSLIRHEFHLRGFYPHEIVTSHRLLSNSITLGVRVSKHKVGGMQAYELQQCIFSHHFWHQYLYQDIWLQAAETNFSKKKIHKIEQRAEESSLERAETKYIKDILRQEELKSLIHVPLMEYISKIICIFFLSLWYFTQDSKSEQRKNSCVPPLALLE